MEYESTVPSVSLPPTMHGPRCTYRTVGGPRGAAPPGVIDYATGMTSSTSSTCTVLGFTSYWYGMRERDYKTVNNKTFSLSPGLDTRTASTDSYSD